MLVPRFGENQGSTAVRATPVNFDRLAPFYRTMERITAGGKLQRCRLAFLGEIPVPRNVLLAGEGHGRFLPECVKRFPDARIVVVDSSQRMLEIARANVESSVTESGGQNRGSGHFCPLADARRKRKRETHLFLVPSSGRTKMSAPHTGIHAAAHHIQFPPVESERVEFVCADFLQWEAPRGQFDLIVTNFFLDCFPPDELTVVVGKLGQLAAPDADWLLADFEIAPAGPARWRSRWIVATLYRFFRIVTGLKADALVPPDEDLAKAGFTRHRRITREWGLLKSEWWRRFSTAMPKSDHGHGG